MGERKTNVSFYRILFVCMVYLVIFLTVFMFCQKVPAIGDDPVDQVDISKYQGITGFFSFINYKYATWSSRWIINLVMFLLIKLPRVVFSLITAALSILSIDLMCKAITALKKGYVKNLLLIILTFGQLPFVYFSTAGWISTTTTYYFPLLSCIIGVSLLILKTSLVYDVLSFLLLCYAFNNEELMAQAFIIILVMIIRKRLNLSNKNTWLLITAVMLNLTNSLMCPGNRLRVLSETRAWFPNFNRLSLLNKIDIGIYTTAQHYLFGINIPIIVFCLVLLIAMFKRVSSHKVKYVSLVPLLCIVLGNICYYLANHFKKGLNLFTFNKEGLFYHYPLHWQAALFQYGLIAIFIVSVTYSLIKLEQDDKWITVDLTLLFSALISRTAIGLSPTSYVSSTRTFTFLSFTFLVLIIIICTRHLSGELKYIYPILVSGTLFNVIYTILFTFCKVSTFHLWVNILFN